jgi:hypothetical protein
MMSLICVGYQPAAAPGAEQFIAPASAPVNYKDPKKIADYVAAAHAKQLEEAHKKPLTATLLDIFFVSGGEALSPDLSSGSRLDFLRGFDLIAVIETGLFRSLVIAEHIDRFGSLGGHQWIVISQRSGIPYLTSVNTVAERTPVIFDPIHAITGSTAEESNVPEFVAARFGAKIKGKTIAERRAWLAYDLCQKLGVSG